MAAAVDLVVADLVGEVSVAADLAASAVEAEEAEAPAEDGD